MRRGATEDLKASDPNTYKVLTEKLVDGTLTERDANLARARNLLSTKDYTFFKGAVPNDEKGESKDVKDFARFLVGNKGYIALSAGRLKDVVGESRFTEYQSDMMEMLPKLQAAGKTPEQIQEYARMALPKYVFSKSDLSSITKAKRTTGNIGIAPSVDPPPIPKDGETIYDFMKGKPVDRVEADGVELKYTNTAATRNQKLVPVLENKLQHTVGQVLGRGYTVEVFSGGQEPEGERRTGSHRHDEGHAADVYIIGPDGKKVTDRATLNKIKDYWLKNKYGSVGTFMPGMGMHLDNFTKEKLSPGQSLTWNY